MSARSFQSLALLLVLMGVALSGFAHAGHVVVCQDGHGGMKIEIGCERTPAGECASSTCGSGEDQRPAEPAPRHPCEDTPVAKDPIAAAVSRLASLTPVDSVWLPVFWSPPWAPCAVPAHFRWADKPPSPPNLQTHIQTVILRI